MLKKVTGLILIVLLGITQINAARAYHAPAGYYSLHKKAEKHSQVMALDDKLREKVTAILEQTQKRFGIDLSERVKTLSSMGVSPNLFDKWFKSNKALYALHLKNRMELPSLLDVREGIVFISQGESNSLTALHALGHYKVKKKPVKMTNTWYRVVVDSKQNLGRFDGNTQIPPIFMMTYSDKLPQHIRVYNNAKVFLLGDCQADHDVEVTLYQRGMFCAENLNASSRVIVHQRGDSKVIMKGSAKSLFLGVQDRVSCDAAELKSEDVVVNVLCANRLQVKVNPVTAFYQVGKVTQSSLVESVNSSLKEPKILNPAWQTTKRILAKVIPKYTWRTIKGIVFTPLYVTYKTLKAFCNIDSPDAGFTTGFVVGSILN